jgi:DNA-binding transcriptional MerR regulator
MQDKSSRRILTVNEVCDEFGIPISTQRLWRAEGRFVPWYRAGTRIVYRRELVERWIEDQEQKEQAIRLATRTGVDEA